MKKRIFSLSLLSVFCLYAVAQGAHLTITSDPNQKFWVFINDVLQNEFSTHSIQIEGFQETTYKIRVEMDNPDCNILGQTVRISRNNNENKFSVMQDRRNNYLFQKSAPSTHVSHRQRLILSDYKRPPQRIYCLPDADFEQALSMIKKERFASEMKILAKQIITSNSLCALQIVEICKAFTFESEKLEIAKYAYPYCVDRNNYFFVNEAFSYSSSKRALNEYIEEHEHKIYEDN